MSSGEFFELSNTHLQGSISAIVNLCGTISAAVENCPPPDSYVGQYQITPDSDSEQILNCKDRYMTDDVVVSKIPYSEVSNTSNGITVYIGKDVFEDG